MEIRLINLDRSADRLASFNKLNAHLTTVRRVSAVDGKLADRARLIANNVLAPDLHYTDGALGCSLSHLVQWRDAIQLNVPLTIVEDDAILSANFESEVARQVEQLPDDWDYIMWGYNFDAYMTFDFLPGFSHATASFDQDALRAKSDSFGSETVETRLFKLFSGFGTVCYSISPRGAQRLLDFCLPLRAMDARAHGYPHPLENNCIDRMLLVAWPAIKAFVSVPPLVVTNNERSTSTVQVSASPIQPPLLDTERPSPFLDELLASSDPAPDLAVPIRSTTRRNLVVMRSGDEGLFGQWPKAKQRNWDFAISHYGKMSPNWEHEYFISQKGPKWRPIYDWLSQNPHLLDQYDLFWFPDDDIMTDWETVNRLFDICNEFDLQLAQPALTKGSYFSHEVTLEQPECLLRFTHFVEGMAAVFSADALRRCFPVLQEKTRFGWGQDWVFPKLLGYPRSGIAIVDDCAVSHTRPVGVNTDRAWAEREQYEIAYKHGARCMDQRVRGAVFRQPLKGRIQQ